MSAQDFNLDQSLATKFQALLGATRQRQHRQPAPALGRNAPTRVYTAEQLQTMSLVELRNVLHSLGSSNLGSLPKWQLIAYALQKQDEVQQQQQHMLFTESELKSMAFSELEEIALNLNIQDVSDYLHSEVVQLILATQLSLSENPIATLSSSQAPTLRTDTYNTPPPSAPPPPTFFSPEEQQSEAPVEAVGIAECALCCEQMGGNAPRSMASPPCGHPYCYDCWMEVTERSKRCPRCNRPVKAGDITKLFT